ncbi:MAG: hypothetical protein NUW01_06630 [Gemmatimonadaceae bacterium]|nr:hypothetical protein [Gemmatimonadaceae bacterium]
MKTTYVGIVDAPVTRNDGDVIDRERFVVERPAPGRVLFTHASAIALVVGVGATISNCVFETIP